MESKKRCFQTLFIFLLLKFISAFQMSPVSSYLVNSFPSAPNATLNHFTVSENGSVYIGAVDNLYHLSRNFNIQSHVAFQNGGNLNVNKIIAIVPFPVNNLISCGTGLNGTCQLRNLDGISQNVRWLSSQTLAVAPEDDSTVGLVVEEASEKITLYVAQTVRKEDRLLRSPISAICLHRKEQSKCENRKTNVIATSVKDDFIIHYVAVFSYQGYTYFIASQREDATKQMDASPIVPQISRLCHNDTSEELSGFTEITLECNGTGGTLYNTAKSAVEVNGRLYVAFVKSISERGAEFNGANQSALCMYEMEKLRKEFEDSIVNCTCNAETRSSSVYLSSSVCETLVDCDLVKGFTCYPPPSLGSSYPKRSPLLGALPGLPIFESSGTSFSSVMVTEIDQPIRKTVAIIGTSEGTLLKVHFDADLRATGILYEALEMGYSVLRDTWINITGETAMFLTEKQLLEITLANCSQYKTCEECIKPGSDKGDPYCGWCTLEKRCTKYAQCKRSSIPSRWLGCNETSCSAITNVKPSSLSVDVDSQMVVTTLSHLPIPNEFNYVCHFGPNFTSAATFNDGLLSCLSPGITNIPRIPDKDDAVEVVFAISTTDLNISFVTTLYAFFNCSRIKGCRDCVSKWTCDWCIDELHCSYKFNSICYNITSFQSLRDDAADSCPLLVPGKAMVPSGVNREIQVTATTLNLTNRLLQREYECVIKSEETMPLVFVSSASITAASNGEYNVTCKNLQYSYSLEKQEISAFLTLRWKNTGVFLDGVYNVTLYKCDIDRPDCSRCLSNITTSPELKCGWCSATQGFCAVEENCSSKLILECNDPPQISSVTPSSSPIEGGTVVEINGTDLGQRFSDISSVTLAGVVCDHQCCEEKYQVGASLTCVTGNSSTERQGTISVHVTNGEAEYERDDFSYNNPQISSFHPTVGPKSGGTLLTIKGTYLQTGRDISVEVGEYTCTILQHSTTSIVCKNKGLTGNKVSAENQTISVNFDGNERLATEKFVYHNDPIVVEVYPLRSILSGGNLLTVTGERFHLIKKSKIQFTIDGYSAEEECFSQSENEVEIMCKLPSILALMQQRRRRAESEGTVAVGFIMDGVTELLHWSQNNSVVFQYFKDPQYETFDVRDHQQTTNNFLTLAGTDLNLASSIRDVTVYFGTELCEVKSLDTKTLFCELPSEQPEPGDLYGKRKSRNLPFVIVRHANLEFEIGYIRYTAGAVVTLWIVTSVLFVFVIVVIVIVLVSTLYTWSKKTETIRDLELEIRDIEESVDANLKALFATLRTTMQDFETAIREQTRIPLLDKRQYLLNMLFHDLRVEPLASTSEETVKSPNLKLAMEEFSILLYHKSFLKVFITTLDKITSISPMEKANIGSLLCVCLLQDGKMKLYTDVLLTLMQEIIKERDIKGKRHLLFSRNDSLVVKLTSIWVSVFLYGFLKQRASTEIYQLYEAVKYVCEMGPIDAVSGKSQFSINDQQMLETQIEFNEVKLNFATKSGGSKPLKVLDVNTITQLKDNIISHNYRYLPYSQRPSPFALDLICRTGESDHMILRDDENLPGSLKNGWKKINTLADFGVPTDSTFELLPNEKYLYETISNETGRRADNADYQIHHTYYRRSQDYGDISSQNYNVETKCDILQSRRKSDDVNKAKDLRLVSSDSTFLLVTEQENPDTAIDSNEMGRQGDSTDYTHHLYQLGDPLYEDIPLDSLNVATNGDMLQSKGKSYDVNVTEGVRLWHLVKEDEKDLGHYEDVPDPRSHKEIKETVLSFLPPTMNNIQKFVDNLMDAIFAANGRAEVPLSIKYLFQFFDQEAEKKGKPELAQAWKNNVLPLDFWSTIIANPQYVLDVGKYAYTHASLETIVQVIKDTCVGSVQTHKNQDCSTSRFLYSHFVKGYISKLDNYYLFIRNLGRVDSEDFRQECEKVEQEFQGIFDLISTQRKLFGFVADYQKELTEALEEDDVCKELSHAIKLRRVAEKIK